MELSEILAMRHILVFKNTKINPILVTNVLRQNRVISEDQCSGILKIISSIEQPSQIRKYIDKIGSLISFKNFIGALRHAGYTK